MCPRDPGESHRAATPLELFFDLVFVVAIAQAASGLHHAISADHLVAGLRGYLLAFFAIWWAWMNFTWFASAYDCDDVPYRLTVFLQLTGALIFAAGVPGLMNARLEVVVAGYVVMRLAMVVQWLRAAAGDPARRTTARRYALGITLLQACWVGLLFAPAGAVWPVMLALVAGELAVPVWAESAAATPWHRHHIVERYGLLTIIVLGESVLASTLAIRAALEGGSALGQLLPTIVGGLLILYSMWWLYFDHPAHDLIGTLRRAFVWGYAHYAVFAAAAAVGAGLSVVIDVATGHAEIGATTAAWAVAAPVAIYIACLWFLLFRRRPGDVTPAWLAPGAIVAVLAMPSTPWPVLGVGLLLAAVLAAKFALRHRAGRGAA